MGSRYEITLEDLALVALNKSQLNRVHIRVLHCLMNILLKKLNCKEEKILISDIECMCFKNVLKYAEIPSINCDDNHLEVITKKLNKIVVLEARIQRISNRLEAHFQTIRQCDIDYDLQFLFKKWDIYTSPCEDLCTLCDQRNKLICKLLKNTSFLKQLLRYLSEPLTNRIIEFEAKTDDLCEEFIKFLDRADEMAKKVQLIDQVTADMDELGEEMEENHLKFIATMEEVQDMLDAKLDKIHLPALKKYIKQRFEGIEAHLDKIQVEKKCKKAAGVIVNNYFSCIENKGFTPISCDKLKTNFKEKTCIPKKLCNCDKLCLSNIEEPKLLERIQNLQLNSVAYMLKTNEDRKSCKLPEGTFQLLTGTNGNFYRKG